MRDAIGNQQIIRPHGRVIAGDLIERLLSDFHAGRLAFCHENGFSPAIVDDNVGAVLHTPVRKSRFDRGSTRRKPQAMDEVLYQVLADPFLGREAHVFPAKRIENGPFFAGGANIKVVLARKIQTLHRSRLQSTGQRRQKPERRASI